MSIIHMETINEENDEYVELIFEKLNLKKNIFEEKLFENCKFAKCDFSECTFKNCKFVDCEFIDCNLSLLNIHNSVFFDVIVENSKMIGVDWTKAKWPQINLTSPIKFYKCNISHSNFFGLSLADIVFETCKANEVDFRDADLSCACFRESDLYKSLFIHTNLSGADFIDSINYNIDINLNTLKKAKFSFPDVVTLLNNLDIEIVGLENN